MAEVSMSPLLSPQQARQKKVLRVILTKFGSALASSSSNNLLSPSAEIRAMARKAVTHRDTSIDEEEDVESIDCDDLFKVVSHDDFFVVERSKQRSETNDGKERSKWSMDDEEDLEDGDSFLSLEDILSSKFAPQHQNAQEGTSSGIEASECPTAPLTPSLSRRMIKSLPRAFKASNLHVSTDVNQLFESKISMSSDESSSASPHSPTLSLKDVTAYDERHRQLLKDMSRRFRGSKERLLNIDKTEEMQQVESAIMDRQCKAKLTDALVAEKEDLLVKMHFCSTVTEYERLAEGKIKRAKGEKITRMFISKDSMFRLHGIPQSYESQLLGSKRYEYLEILKLMCLEELSSNEAVMKVLFGSKFNVLST